MHFSRPPALKPGDRVAVCAPSGPVDSERLEKGVAELRQRGFQVVVPPGLLDRRGFTAGSPERRQAELYEVFEDPGIAAVVGARGGAGLVQLMPGLDVARLTRRPKVFVGYSDLTFLHAVLNNAGLVTFHGPMVARELGQTSGHGAALVDAVTGKLYASDDDDELLPLRAGVAEGRLLGGCLSILAAGLGTPWALRSPDEDVILFLEDVDEAPYRIDRMLRQLKGAGLFERVRGIVLGDLPGCSPPLDADFTLEEVVIAALADVSAPIALGLSSGHTASTNVTLPFGVLARLECTMDRASFRILEPGVSNG